MSLKMKLSYNSLDIAIAVNELKRLIGYRVDQIFDVDEKTFLFKLHKGDDKCVLLMESGVRFHMTKFDWQKSMYPSNFTMKLRKHLRNRRIEKIERLGKDRIVDFQIGSGPVTHHLILELFNRGNLILSDSNWQILRVLRPHTEGDRFKFVVREEYPVSRVMQHHELPDLQVLFNSAKAGDKILKILLPHVDFGPSLLEHLLLTYGFKKDKKYTGDISPEELQQIKTVLTEGRNLMEQISSNVNPGYIIKHIEHIEGHESLTTYFDVQPYLFMQYADMEFEEFINFNAAADEYFSNLENNRKQYKMVQKQKEAIDKVEKVKADQEKRVEELIIKQSDNVIKAELILANSVLIDQIIMAIRQAIAAQMQWSAITSFVAGLYKQKDPIGLTVDKLKLEINHITVSLNDPYDFSDIPRKVSVDLDLALSAHANATRYYSESKMAAVKERKTMEAQEKVLKSVQLKAKNLLKDVEKTTTITVARKPLWFEKFYWFVSSERYLVIGGRDQQQNEVIVKRYMKQGDIYVHADLHGASTVVIKNPGGNPVPPRTLEEAGCMAVCYSVGWEAKVISSAWWVYSHQVSKAAPTGEYLTTGSFMIRGTKNYLFPAQLCLGFGFMFRLDEESALRHIDERKPKWIQVSEEEEYIPEDSQDDGKISYSPIMDPQDDGKISYSPTMEPNETENMSLSSEDYDIPDDKFFPGMITDDDKFFPRIYDECIVPNETIYQEKVGETKANLPEKVVKSETEDLKSNVEVASKTVTDEKPAKQPHESTKRISKKERKQLKKLKKVAKFDKGQSNSAEEDIDKKEVCDVEDAEEKQGEYVCILGDRKSSKSDNKDIDQDSNDDDLNIGASTSRENLDQVASCKIILKRGQKSKQKKIKEKYKDQDEEERNLRMAILKPDGEKKLTKKEQKDLKKYKKHKKTINKEDVKVNLAGKFSKLKENLSKVNDNVTKDVKNKPEVDDNVNKEIKNVPEVDVNVNNDAKDKLKEIDDNVNKEITKDLPEIDISKEVKEEDDCDDDNNNNKEEDNNLLESLDIVFKLTGQPLPEDDLLFALPIVAPYTALNSFKYKIKLIPGSVTRGKAAKMALNNFLKSRECIEKEKQLIKKISIEIISRNFPGKVKLNLLKNKK